MIYTIVKKDSNDSIVAIMTLDVFRDFTESWTATVANQVVENGFNITDNINIEPVEFSLTGLITQYSIHNLGKKIQWNDEEFTTQVDNVQPYHIQRRQELLSIFQTRSVVTLLETSENSFLEDKTQRYEDLKSNFTNEVTNCVITNVDISIPERATNAFNIGLRLRRVNVATVETKELTKEEMSNELQPLVAESKTVSSNTSTTTDKQANGTVAGKSSDIANSKEAVKSESKSSGGLAFEDGAKYAREREQLIEDEIKAVHAAADRNNIDGKWRQVQSTGSGYRVDTFGVK